MPDVQRPAVMVRVDNLPQILSQLSVGDLIFRHGTKLGLDATFIRRFQRNVGKYPAIASNITHVAVYSGAGKVIHAVPPVACEDDFGHYFEGSRISAVTWSTNGRPREETAKDIITQMRQNIGTSYPIRNLFTECIKEASRLHTLDPRLDLRKKEQLAICSEVVFGSFDLVMDVDNPLDSDDIAKTLGFLVPAHLFLQPRLIDIDLR